MGGSFAKYVLECVATYKSEGSTALRVLPLTQWKTTTHRSVVLNLVAISSKCSTSPTALLHHFASSLSSKHGRGCKYVKLLWYRQATIEFIGACSWLACLTESCPREMENQPATTRWPRAEPTTRPSLSRSKQVGGCVGGMSSGIRGIQSVRKACRSSKCCSLVRCLPEFHVALWRGLAIKQRATTMATTRSEIVCSHCCHHVRIKANGRCNDPSVLAILKHVWPCVLVESGPPCSHLRHRMALVGRCWA